MTAFKRRLLGVGFLLTVAMLIATSVLIYQKAFTPVVRVTLKAGTAGSQLLRGADVKLRGIIVGDVRSITTDGRTASIGLALDEDEVGLIPANVRARLLPKTLFGEKYVDLVLPPDPAPEAIRSGRRDRPGPLVHGDRAGEGARRRDPAAARDRPGEAVRHAQRAWPPRSRGAVTSSAPTSSRSTTTSCS